MLPTISPTDSRDRLTSWSSLYPDRLKQPGQMPLRAESDRRWSRTMQPSLIIEEKRELRSALRCARQPSSLKLSRKWEESSKWEECFKECSRVLKSSMSRNRALGIYNSRLLNFWNTLRLLRSQAQWEKDRDHNPDKERVWAPSKKHQLGLSRKRGQGATLQLKQGHPAEGLKELHKPRIWRKLCLRRWNRSTSREEWHPDITRRESNCQNILRWRTQVLSPVPEHSGRLSSEEKLPLRKCTAKPRQRVYQDWSTLRAKQVYWSRWLRI